MTARPEAVEPPEIRPEVLAAVSRLSVKQRAVIVLAYSEDLDPAAIAMLMSISEGSVKRSPGKGSEPSEGGLRCPQLTRLMSGYGISLLN